MRGVLTAEGGLVLSHLRLNEGVTHAGAHWGAALFLDELADKIESVDELDGVTVELKGTEAWFNVRASNTEPLLRLNVEAKTADEVQAIVDEVLAIIRR